MLGALQKRGNATRILLAVVIGMIALAMLITLLPGTSSSPVASGDALAEVDGHAISTREVERQMQRISGGREVPAALRSLYVRQILDQLVMERMLEVEAERMGLRVTRQELADRIRRMLPSAQAGEITNYVADVQIRYQMGVQEFEELVRRGMLQEKFAQLVTDGVTSTTEEIQQEFQRQNEKIKIEYALIKPDDLESKIQPSDAELAAHFEKNKATYQVPERRAARYAILEFDQIRRGVSPTDAELRAWYNEHIDRYRHPDRARISHIQFSTVGKTDAEVAEVRQKADEALKRARGAAKFEDLAKQNSDDQNTKDKGGEVGWIQHGQTEPDYETAAFGLPVGKFSELVKTRVGFYIIKVNERERARTEPFEEVRAQIVPIVTQDKADAAANATADRLASAIRQNARATLDESAKQFNMRVGEASAVAAGQPIGELGSNPELDSLLFRLQSGEVSQPVRLERGYAVLSVKSIEPQHQGTLAEVHGRVLDDFRRARVTELAKTRAEELAARAKSGVALAAAAKAAGFEVKTSEAFSRTGSLPEVGSARPLAGAFAMQPGTVGPATSLGANWIVYKVVAREGIKPDQIIQQLQQVQQQVLQDKRRLAFEAFSDALKQRMTRDGKLKYNTENLNRIAGPAGF